LARAWRSLSLGNRGLLIIGVAKALRLVLEIIKAFSLNQSGRSPDLLAPSLGSFDRSTVTGQLAPYFS
jgi:hypothetical protein